MQGGCTCMKRKRPIDPAGEGARLRKERQATRGLDMVKRASFLDEPFHALREELRLEHAALLSEIREEFSALRLEMLAQEGYAVPVGLCLKLYEAIYRVVGEVPFTALRIIEESTLATVDAVQLREALATVLPKDGMTHNKLTRFLKWDANPEAGPWRLCVHRDRTGEGRMFRVYRHDEK